MACYFMQISLYSSFFSTAGFICAGMTAITFDLTLLSICYYSLISVCAYTSLSVLMLVLAVKLYSYVMVMLKKAEPGSDPLAKVAAMEVTIPSDKVSELSNGLADKLNCCLPELRRLFLVDNMVDTIKFGLSLWCLTYIGSWFNAMTLVILAWVTAFTVPKIYQNNQAAIDEVLGKVKVQLDVVKSKVMAVMPAQMKPAVEKKEE
jgi:hypothetical protein